MQPIKYLLSVTITTFFCISVSYAQISYEDIQILIEKDKHKEALNLTEDHLSRNKTDVKFQFLKGLILAHLNRYADAEKIFHKIAEENPALPEPLNNLAVIYAVQGKYIEAEDMLKKALDTNSNYATTYNNLGDIYAKAASHAYNKALGLGVSKATNQEKLLLLNELILPQTKLIESLEQENLELKKVVKDSVASIEERKRTIAIKNEQLAKLGETRRSIQKLIQEKVELNVKMNELKSSLDEVMYSLTLKDEQLAKLENTQKSFQSLAEENNKLKNRLSQTEGSLGELNRSLTLKDEQLAKLENTQKSFQSLAEENNKLKNRLSQTEGSLGELNRSLTLKDEQLAKLDKSLNKTMTKDLKKENDELKNKVEKTESLLEDLKRSVTFRKQNSKDGTQEKESREETIEVVNLNKRTDHEDTLNDKPKTELEQKKIVELSINQWVNSWSSKDIEAYIASYAPEFKPSRGLSRNAWEKGRRKRLANPAFIQITLANMVVDLRGEDLAKITFRQKYQSDTYSDEVNKEITVKMINDKWLITRERVQ